MSSRALVYVESLLGIGHGVRAAAITRALLERGFEVTYITGNHRPDSHDISGAKLVQMPMVRAYDANFSRLVNEAGDEINESSWNERCKILLATYRTFQPHVILIEGYPFSRWQFRFELNPLLNAAKQNTAIVCSIRDILVEKRDPQRIREIVELIRSKFDMVLVHGDEALVELDKSFPGCVYIADKLQYTGYVSASGAEPSDYVSNADSEVLVSVGGGAVGYRLLHTALEVRALGTLDDRTWRFLVGPNLPDKEINQLQIRAKNLEGVIIERYRQDFLSLLSRCCVSISQGGYNTIVDILAARAPAIVVPFGSDSETEQTQRSRLLGNLGLLKVVCEGELETRSLAKAVIEVAASARPKPSTIALDGARQSAAQIFKLVTARQKS